MGEEVGIGKKAIQCTSNYDKNIDSAIKTTPLTNDLAASMTLLSFDEALSTTPLSHPQKCISLT
jgi:hypothetical protein